MHNLWKTVTGLFQNSLSLLIFMVVKCTKKCKSVYCNNIIIEGFSETRLMWYIIDTWLEVGDIVMKTPVMS